MSPSPSPFRLLRFAFALDYISILWIFLRPRSHVVGKKLLETTMARVQILKERREVQLRHLLRQVARLVNCSRHRKPEIQLECLWAELCLLSLYVKVREYCNKVRINLDIICGQRQCPIDLEEPVASLCFVASRCSVFPELHELREIFAVKYGSEFVISAQELKDGSHVNQSLLDLLSTKAPHEDVKQELNEYVLARTGKEDGSILKGLLELVSRNTRANEHELFHVPSLELHKYRQHDDLEEGEEEEEELKGKEAWMLNEDAALVRASVHSSPLYNMSSTYGKRPFSSRFKRMYRGAIRKGLENGIRTRDHIFNDDDEGADDDDDNDDDDDDDEHSISVVKEEATCMGGYYYASDTGSSDGEDNQIQWHCDRHVGSSIRSVYGGDSCMNQLPLTRAPERVPPPLPTNLAEHGVPNNHLRDHCIPPDFEHVAARVAELSANTLTKDLRSKLTSESSQ